MIGQKIHSYEIIAHLGKGGMGNVYKATDTMLGRDVALKMLHPQLTMESQFLERFKKEARVLAQLLHPNIAVIYNFIEQDNNHFMVMEFVEGTNLDDLLKKYGALPAAFVVPVFIQVLEGLQHAHKKNIFHRDIKPANIMLTPDDTVKLMDFGIAKVAGEQKMTQVNKIVGTVEFMAPELIQGKDASAASDIYATGVTLYELLTGRLPIEGDTDFNLMHAILKQKIIQPGKFNATIPKVLGDIIMKALDKNPANRYTDAKAFQQALMQAFPNYRTINMASLQVAPSMSFAQEGSLATRIEKITGGGMETRAEIWAKPASLFESFKQNGLKNKKLYLTLLLILCSLVLTIGLVKNNGSGKGDGGNGDKENQLVDVRNPYETSEAGPVENNNNTRNIVPTPSTPEKEKEKEPVVKKPVVKEETDNEKKENPEEEKPAVKKNIVVGSKVEIELYLQNDLSNSPDRQDIPVTFSLTRPVVYGGVTIINQGAIAKGIIKLGKIQTDVGINTIMAANGQTISIKAERGHGRKNEISSKRNYTAIIEPGTRINF